MKMGFPSWQWQGRALIARSMGPTWGPAGADRTQVGPMLATWTLLSGTYSGHNNIVSDLENRVLWFLVINRYVITHTAHFSWWRHQMETFSMLLALPFVRVIHRSSVVSPHKGQWRGALMFSLVCAWTNCWANNRDAGDLRRHVAHCDITVMHCFLLIAPSGYGNILLWYVPDWWRTTLQYLVRRTQGEILILSNPKIADFW